MGAKYYRASERPKKIWNRLDNTRTFFRDHKWTACKFVKCSNSMIRPRASKDGCRPSVQGRCS